MIGVHTLDILKALARVFVEPSGIISFLLLVGIVLLVWRRHRKKSTHVFAAALILYVIFGTGPVAFWLLGSLEFRYPPYVETAANREAENIVVLAGYAGRDDEMPLSSHVGEASAIRILEAVRIFRLNPGRRIIVSGKDDVPVIMKDVLVSLGISAERIEIEGRSGSTMGSGVNLATLLKGKKIILVTSAGHMERSIRVFRKFGMHPVPAPTDFMTRRNFLATGYLPSPLYLRLSDLAVHEYVGILWYGGSGAINKSSVSGELFSRQAIPSPLERSKEWKNTTSVSSYASRPLDYGKSKPWDHSVEPISVEDMKKSRFRSDRYYDFINEDVIRLMFKRGLNAFSGSEETRDAWRNILLSYKPGDKISIRHHRNTSMKV